MSDRPSIHVTYDGDREEWRTRRAGASRASGYFTTAEEALASARKTAVREGVELIKHRKDDNTIGP